MLENASIQQSENLGVEELRLSAINPTKMPSDRVAKAALLKVFGHITVSYTGTKPVARKGGVIRNLIDRITAQQDQGKAFMNVTPDYLEAQTKYSTGSGSSKAYKKNSMILDTFTEGDFELGTSGQAVAFSEALYIPFEHQLSGDPDKTHWNLNGLANAKIEVIAKNIKDLFNEEDQDRITVNVNATSIKHSITINSNPLKTLEEAAFSFWTRDYSVTSISGSGKTEIEIPAVGLLQGLWLTVSKGANGELANYDESGKIEIELVVNGNHIIKKVTLADIIDENRTKHTLREITPGKAYMNLSTHGLFASGVPTTGLNSFKVRLRMPTGMPYTGGGVECRLDTNSIVGAL